MRVGGGLGVSSGVRVDALAAGGAQVKPWTPAQLAGLTFDGDPSTLSGADGSTIASLPNAARGTYASLALDTSSTGTKPTLDKTHTINGLPVIAMTSSPASELYTTGGPTWGSAPFDVFVVARYASTSNNNAGKTTVFSAGAAVDGGFALVGSNAGLWFEGSFDGSEAHVATTTAIDTSWHLHHLTYDGANVSARLDGALLGSGPVSLSLAAGFGIYGLNFGGPVAFAVADAYVARLLVCADEGAALSDAQRLQVEAYFARRYGLTLT